MNVEPEEDENWAAAFAAAAALDEAEDADCAELNELWAELNAAWAELKDDCAAANADCAATLTNESRIWKDK